LLTTRSECVQSLYFPEWNARRDQVIDAEKGTNEWLWTNDQYQRWEAASSAILWIEGKPGSGKSVLAKSLQRKLNAARSRTGTSMSGRGASRGDKVAIVRSKIPSDTLVADWFYSTRMGEVGTAHLSLLRSILYQLLQQDASLFKAIASLYRLKPIGADTKHGWNMTECQKALEHIANSGMEVICIIDAMDEAEQTESESKAKKVGGSRVETMLRTLGSLSTRLKSSKMKFIVLSRPDSYIEVDFNKMRKTGSETYKIVLERENQKDIDMIIGKGLLSLRNAINAFESDSEDDYCDFRGSRKYRGLPTSSQKLYGSEKAALNSIGDFLRQNAEGVILWVNLVIGELEDLALGGGAKLHELDKHARKLPHNLEEKDGLYDHIVEALHQRRKGANIPRARSIFMLILGSVKLARPLRVREVWEALAVPIEGDNTVNSNVDPIIGNRPMIKSWTGFRRHLRIICGPFVEIILGSEQICEPESDNIGPDDIVQFIHRTVKDFLQVPGRAGQLHFTEETAIYHTKFIATTYLQLTFPEEEPQYGPQASRWKAKYWLEGLEEYVEYLQERNLLQFCLFALHHLDPNHFKLAQLRQSHSFILLRHCPYRFDQVIVEGKIRKFYPAFNTLARRKNPSFHQAIALGECIRNACSKGFVVATRNLLEICDLTTTLGNCNVEDLQELIYGAKNGALVTAVVYDLEPLVRSLTRAHRHQSGLVDAMDRHWPIGDYSHRRDLDPFIQIAVRSGSVGTVIYLFDHTDRFYARNAAIREFAVTSRNLPELSVKPSYHCNFEKRSRSPSPSSISSLELSRLGLVEARSSRSQPKGSVRGDQSESRTQPRGIRNRQSRSQNPHREFKKLKNTCIKLAKRYHSTQSDCAIEDVRYSLELVASMGVSQCTDVPR
jgi:adenylate kinase family enzyme